MTHKSETEARQIADRVRATATEQKLRTFYDALRSSAIPFLPAMMSDPAALFRASFDALYILGQASLPLTVGLTMHQYMFAGLASVRVTDSKLTRRLREFVDDVKKRKAIVAVSSVGGNVSTPGVTFTVTRAGNDFIMNGERSFQSIASEADFVTVAAPVDGGELGAFIVPMKGRAGVEVGALVFGERGGPMALTDTRKVTFTDYRATAAELVTLDPKRAHQLGVYSTAWFEALIGAAYLGGAAAALEELRTFARSSRTADGPLSSLDGVVVDAGRLGISLRTSLALARSFTSALSTATEDDDFMSTMMAGTLVKYACTRTAESIVGGVRRLLGTRAMRPGGVVADVSGQVVFGPLHPWLEAELERNIGREVLGDMPFPDV